MQGNEPDYSTGFPSSQQQQSQSPNFQQQQLHQQQMGPTTDARQKYTPPKSSDGIRRYNDRGEE